MRIEVLYKDRNTDGRSHRLLSQLQKRYQWLRDIIAVDVFLISHPPAIDSDTFASLFSDLVAQRCFLTTVERQNLVGNAQEAGRWDFLLEITYKAGVTDPVAITAAETLRMETGEKLSPDTLVQTAHQYIITVSEKVQSSSISTLAHELYNPLIQHITLLTREDWTAGKAALPMAYPHVVDAPVPEVKKFDMESADEQELIRLSQERLLALTGNEMNAIRDYLVNPEIREERIRRGIGKEITDVELEMLAQTWSEHCKHKIFNATITYTENGTSEVISSLFDTYIKETTERLWEKKPFLRSVFHDNSGVIAFDGEHLLCFKVETHNSPSALDPYGGAITGIVGVNRDIIGTGRGAKPIFNTDVLCFGYPDTPRETFPKELLHPQRVLSGVHHGIVDGGNQSGIPVIGGAFLFDDSYAGKPLVFCGTGGILPTYIGREEAWKNRITPGEKAVMVGGRIGKDGIHGATFSSLALDEESPTSAVQIGDPITQKKMLDFLLVARDRELFAAITDNGAGGLSSSLGEMAEKSGGVRIELHACPLKYQGLAPWEILVSESQERMSVSVSEDNLDAFLTLAEEMGVEATEVGTFTDSGYVEIYYRSELVGLLDLEFLHSGLPEMTLNAEWKSVGDREHIDTTEEGGIPPLGDVLLSLLSDPNIASKEHLIRQYDHEVQAHSVGKPFVGVHSDAPSDGAVLKPLYDSYRGVTVTHGICPRIGDIDTYHMAQCAVDEAFRAHIACGGDPELVSALDNFCWPDPVESQTTPDGKYKLAQLVRAAKGLRDACLAYEIPLISGKDSMKNDARLGTVKVSIRPTLLVSLMGIIKDIRKAVSTDFKAAGDCIYIVGQTSTELGGSSFHRLTGNGYTTCCSVDLDRATAIYRSVAASIEHGLLSSCHDLSDGGLGVALAESCIGGRLGAEVHIDSMPVRNRESCAPYVLLFAETPSRFLVSVSPTHNNEFQRLMEGEHIPFAQIGTVTEVPDLTIEKEKRILLRLSIQSLLAAWNSFNEKSR